MKHNGNIIKMSTVLNESVKYILSLGDDKIIMNDLIGKIISFKWTGKIICISCGNNINKSFAQGFCYPCFLPSDWQSPSDTIIQLVSRAATPWLIS